MHQVNLINNDDFKGKHNTFGNLLLQPGINYTDCNRGQMFSSHIEQCIQIEESEPPLFFTRFEDQWSKYSSGYLELEGRWKVLAKIVKNDYNYALIVKKTENSIKEKNDIKINGKQPKFKVGEYHVIFRTEAEWLTEKYGYRFNNETIDSLEKGDQFEDEVLYKDYNRDEEMNFQYGRNLNAVYLSYKGLTTEDAIVVSQSTAEKMSSYFVKKIQVSLNTNDILTNMYGTKDFYKSFPDIGEEIKDNLLCSSRRIHYQTAPIALSDMRKPFVGDTSYISKGKVIDIKVISNIDDPDTVLDYMYNKQIKKYYDQERKYYSNFVKYLEPIVNDKNKIISNDLIYYYNRYKMLLDPNNKFKVDGNLFDHLILEFKILDKSPLVVGSKLAGRFGNKGVVSKIYPDDEMPKVIDFAGFGKPDPESEVNMNIDIILNPLGVINRLNPSQLLEMEFNYNSKIIRYTMEQEWNDCSLEELRDYLLDFIKEYNDIQYHFMYDYMLNLNDEELEEFLIEIIQKGIPLYQSPFYDNQNIKDLADIYKYTEAEKSKLEKIENEVIFGEEYFMALKHLPSSKFSARSVDQLSIKNLPVKSNMYKQYKTYYSTTPIKIGKFCRV